MRSFCQSAVGVLDTITTALDADASLQSAAAAAPFSRAQQAALNAALRTDRLAPPASTISEGMEPSVSNRNVVALVNSWCATTLPVTSKPAGP